MYCNPTPSPGGAITCDEGLLLVPQRNISFCSRGSMRCLVCVADVFGVSLSLKELNLHVQGQDSVVTDTDVAAIPTSPSKYGLDLKDWIKLLNHSILFYSPKVHFSIFTFGLFCGLVWLPLALEDLIGFVPPLVHVTMEQTLYSLYPSFQISRMLICRVIAVERTTHLFRKCYRYCSKLRDPLTSATSELWLTKPKFFFIFLICTGRWGCNDFGTIRNSSQSFHLPNRIGMPLRIVETVASGVH